MKMCFLHWVEQTELFYLNKEISISLLTNYINFKLVKLFLYYFELKSLLSRTKIFMVIYVEFIDFLYICAPSQK